MSPIIVDKENKKQEILYAALRVFSRLGIPNVKMIDIAREAGIGKGTIYEYFRSKEEVIDETMKAFLSKMDNVNLAEQTSEHSPLQKVDFIVKGWMDILLADPLEAGVMVEMWAESLRKGKLKENTELREVYKRYRDSIKDIITEGIQIGEIRQVDAGSMATLIAATLDGLYLHLILGMDLVNLEKTAKEYRKSLDQYLRK